MSAGRNSAGATSIRREFGEEETQRRLVGDLLDRAFGGSAAKLVLQAFAATRATAEERRQIRDLLEKEGDDRGRD